MIKKNKQDLITELIEKITRVADKLLPIMVGSFILILMFLFLVILIKLLILIGRL